VNGFIEGSTEKIIGAHEIVGDIALITLPDELLPRRHEIGATLLAAKPRLRVVVRRGRAIRGEFRLSELEVIAGAPPLATLHRENGLRFLVDMEKAYFSARLAGERLRLARLTRQNERILVIGSGVAPLPLTVAAHGGAAELFAIEKNPAAHALAQENLRLNRCHSHKINLYQADFLTITAKDFGLFDRLIVAMPEIAFGVLPHCRQFVKPGGWLHLYVFQDERHPQPTFILAQTLGAAGRQADHCAVVRCGHCGNGRYRLCLEARLA
jgi:tRNA (guanine37-N1)-methyltransferase